jgi:hypothetical protein
MPATNNGSPSGAVQDLSYWISHRKMLTDRFMPDPKWLKELYHKPPYWYTFGFTLNPQQTLEYLQTARANTWLTTITGSSTSGSAGYQCRILHARKRHFWQRLFSDQANVVGSGSYPFRLREPYRIRAGDSIIVQVKNVATAQISGQVAIEGVEDVKPA